jgi:cell fate regulator YaaT (PSP1 superfamily)
LEFEEMEFEEMLYTRGCECKKKPLTGELSCQEKPSCQKLTTFDWLKDVHNAALPSNIVEIRFKNTRKGFYQNVNDLPLQKGDIVAVEASPGHDIGVISLTGDIVYLQMVRNGLLPEKYEYKKVYRKVKGGDIEKWSEAIALEHSFMIRTRKIVEQLRLEMKIGDVEVQGDKTKAIFYYIAEQRVDFRELIKILAEEFHMRIEMRQIGARQEAGRIGGIGTCGRELCCAQWLCGFASVSTNAARDQDIAINQQKLAGQCSKLKCCLNYELASYKDAQKDFPRTNIPLETIDGTAYHHKTDIFKRIMWYNFDKHSMENLVAVPVDRVKEIVEQNKKGTKVEALLTGKYIPKYTGPKEPEFKSSAGEDSITRFDKPRRSSNGGNRSNGNRHGRGSNGGNTNRANGAPQSSSAPREQEPRQGAGAQRSQNSNVKGNAARGNGNHHRRTQNSNNRKPQQGNNGNNNQQK